ncbi:DUF6600 domain-containing protein [Nitrospirillum iridis]|uniref:FecR protein domain-containing protein n=1 Tax=Nitrospirillum iridis TaxID=765888 RepID=A0A7X0AZA3_9PROT|nr:DUF6600 domain-containing protein [Nitrospirillum iridis]MBB6251770.1 hypothetical protein [Nitrospirillum iridis]
MARGTMTALAVLLAFSPLAATRVLAQDDPAAYDAAGDQYSGDPPARVGRLARVRGTVSFHTADATQWDTAIPNYPLTSGNALWTEPGASATVEVSATRLVMDGATELDIDTLDDRTLDANVAQGRVYVRIRGLLPEESYSLRTPRGMVTLNAPGRYEIVAGDRDTPTRVTVLEGTAQLSGDGLSLRLNGGQTGEITGDNPPNVSVRPADHDSFLLAALAADRVGSSTPPAIAAMPGAEDLTAYGSWQVTPDYGQVWYPQVDAGWVPYRQGHWAFVAPWGWTWIDDAPWGFAPFHYGRWVDIGGRWAWAPAGAVITAGPPPPPVYAPALVAFFGAGVAVGIGVGGHPPVGWCPLGWQEPYHPWYRASPRYVEYVNRPVVRNLTVVNNTVNVTINNYVNRRGASMMPADAMVGGRSWGHPGDRPGERAWDRHDGGARPLDERQFANARLVAGRPPVLPTAATAGVTPQLAQRLHLPGPPDGAGPVPRPASPGPQFRPDGAPEARDTRHQDWRGPDGTPRADGRSGDLRQGDFRQGDFRAGQRRPDEPGLHPDRSAPAGLPALRDHDQPPGPPPVHPTGPERSGPPPGNPQDHPQPGQAGPGQPQPAPTPHGEGRRPDGGRAEEARPEGPPVQHAAPPPAIPQPQPRPPAEPPRQPERPQPQREVERDAHPQHQPRPETPQMRPQSPAEPARHMEPQPRPEPPHAPPPQARPEPPRPQAPHPQAPHSEPPKPPNRKDDPNPLPRP